MTTQNLRIPITNVGSRSLVLEQLYEQYMLQHQTASATFCNTKRPLHLFLTNLADHLHFLFCIQQLPFLTKLSLQVMLQQFNFFFFNSSKLMMITQSNKRSILVCKSISANEFFRRNKTFTIPDDLNHPILITFFFIHDAFFFLKHHKASIIPGK